MSVITSHRLSFKGFEGSKVELELLQHILKAARALKTMTLTSDPFIDPLSPDKKFHFLKELLMFARHSSTCQILFS